MSAICDEERTLRHSYFKPQGRPESIVDYLRVFLWMLLQKYGDEVSKTYFRNDSGISEDTVGHFEPRAP